MMRLDKLLTELNIGSRSQVKEYLKKGQISVDDHIEKKAECKVDETKVKIGFGGKIYSYQKYQYLVLNKPAGYITATEDQKQKTVMELLPKDLLKDVAPVGRLDKDTEGLLFFTNNGSLGHFLLSPKRHVDKCYEVLCEKLITDDMVNRLAEGVDIGEEEKTLPATCKKTGDYSVELIIHEGKFHQVKRMLQAVDNNVTFLKRTTFGNLTLEGIEETGEYRFLTEQEVDMLMNLAGMTAKGE